MGRSAKIIGLEVKIMSVRLTGKSYAILKVAGCGKAVPSASSRGPWQCLCKALRMVVPALQWLDSSEEIVKLGFSGIQSP